MASGFYLQDQLLASPQSVSPDLLRAAVDLALEPARHAVHVLAAAGTWVPVLRLIQHDSVRRIPGMAQYAAALQRQAPASIRQAAVRGDAAASVPLSSVQPLVSAGIDAWRTCLGCIAVLAEAPGSVVDGAASIAARLVQAGEVPALRALTTQHAWINTRCEALCHAHARSIAHALTALASPGSFVGRGVRLCQPGGLDAGESDASSEDGSAYSSMGQSASDASSSGCESDGEDEAGDLQHALQQSLVHVLLASLPCALLVWAGCGGLVAELLQGCVARSIAAKLAQGEDMDPADATWPARHAFWACSVPGSFAWLLGIGLPRSEAVAQAWWASQLDGKAWWSCLAQQQMQQACSELKLLTNEEWPGFVRSTFLLLSPLPQEAAALLDGTAMAWPPADVAQGTGADAVRSARLLGPAASQYVRLAQALQSTTELARFAEAVGSTAQAAGEPERVSNFVRSWPAQFALAHCKQAALQCCVADLFDRIKLWPASQPELVPTALLLANGGPVARQSVTTALRTRVRQRVLHPSVPLGVLLRFVCKARAALLAIDSSTAIAAAVLCEFVPYCHVQAGLASELFSTMLPDDLQPAQLHAARMRAMSAAAHDSFPHDCTSELAASSSCASSVTSSCSAGAATSEAAIPELLEALQGGASPGQVRSAVFHNTASYAARLPPCVLHSQRPTHAAVQAAAKEYLVQHGAWQPAAADSRALADAESHAAAQALRDMVRGTVLDAVLALLPGGSRDFLTAAQASIARLLRVLAPSQATQDRLASVTRLVELMKLQFGEAACTPIEIMLRDMADSRRLHRDVVAKLGPAASAPGFPDTVVASHRYWPAGTGPAAADADEPPSAQPLATLHPALHQPLAAVSEAYHAVKQPRRLLWNHAASTVSIALRVRGKARVVHATHWQAAVLLHFNDSPRWTGQQLAVATSAPLPDVMEALMWLHEQGLARFTGDDIDMAEYETDTAWQACGQAGEEPGEPSSSVTANTAEQAAAAAHRQAAADLLAAHADVMPVVVTVLRSKDAGMRIAQLHATLKVFLPASGRAYHLTEAQLRGLLDAAIVQGQLRADEGLYGVA